MTNVNIFMKGQARITCGVLGVGVLGMGGVEDVDGQAEPAWEP